MRNKPYLFYDIPVVNNLKEMVQRRIDVSPNDVAFSFSKGKDGLHTKSFREFSDEINALGTYLYSKGYKNKHIAIIGENSYAWLLSFFAIVNGGNVVVPIDKEQSPDVVANLLKKSDCAAVIYSKSYSDTLNLSGNIDRICITSLMILYLMAKCLWKTEIVNT